MSIKVKLCMAALVLSSCSDAALPNSVNPKIVETPYILEAQEAGVKKFDAELSFIEMYHNKQAVCGDVKRGDGEPQQFIYVRKSFLLQEISPAGEWEAQWVTECDDG